MQTNVAECWLMAVNRSTCSVHQDPLPTLSWIISDLLSGKGTHTYDLMFHLEPAYLNQVDLKEDKSATTSHFTLIPGDQATGVQELHRARREHNHRAIVAVSANPGPAGEPALPTGHRLAAPRRLSVSLNS